MSWLLVLHVVGFVMWMGSLIGLTQILAFHMGEESAVQSRLSVFEAKMARMVWIGMGIVLVSGIWMLVQQNFGPLKASVVGPGFHIKLTAVFGLIGSSIFTVVQANKLAAGDASGSAGKFKALHGVVNLLFLLTVIGVEVLYKG